MRFSSVILRVITICFVLIGTEVSAVSTNQVSAALLGKRVNLDRTGSDFSSDLGKGSRAKNERILAKFRAHTREDVFYSCRGDILKWGEIDDYVNLLLKVSPISLPPQATLEQIKKITENAKYKLSEGAGNQYLQSCLLLSLIESAGISIPESEVLKAISNSVRKVRGTFKSQVLAASVRPEGYLYRRQRGYLLSKKYFDKVIKAQVKVSEAEIAERISQRTHEIAEATAYNATLRPKLEKIRSEILSGKLGFVEAADKYSDCDSAIDDGVLGEFSYSSCPLHKNIRDFIFSGTTNQYSGVIETPYSYHFIKVLARSYDKEDDEEDDEDDASHEQRVKPFAGANVPTKVKIAHVMLEKHEIEEELNPETARVLVRNRKAKEALETLQREFIKKVSAEDGFKCDFKINVRKRRNKQK